MNPELTKQLADACFTLITSVLNDDNGVHAETALASAARMSGMYTLLSFKFNLENVPPGTYVLSDEANEIGPSRLNTLATLLEEYGIDKSLWDKIVIDIPLDNLPHSTTEETETLLTPLCEGLRKIRGVTHVEMAHGLLATTALLVASTDGVLPADVALGIATKGLIEGTKTAPPLEVRG